MKAADAKLHFPTEAALCDLFIREFNALPGWTCYPETGGFDVLVAHESGRQIGVEAKLQLNAKVADQIVPSDSWYRYCDDGPDHRMVIVPCITDSSAGIEKLLRQVGVVVLCPNNNSPPSFGLRHEMWCDSSVSERPSVAWGGEMHHSYTAMFDWNPRRRIALPSVVPNLPAGVPAPVQLTPWKMAALRVLARLRIQGSITAKQIAAEGVSPSMWTQRWLARSDARGQWLESDAMPPLDKQHPEVYAQAVAEMKARLQPIEPLTEAP